MTVRFRPVETNELVDDERAAQRIYMGSAMTMEPGEHARLLAPCRRYASDVCREPPSPILQPQPFILHSSQYWVPRSRLPAVHFELPHCDA
jgi:hypothetical protein